MIRCVLPELSPLLPRLLDVAADSWGVIVMIGDDAPQTFELPHAT